jgi:hypothetical protein
MIVVCGRIQGHTKSASRLAGGDHGASCVPQLFKS